MFLQVFLYYIEGDHLKFQFYNLSNLFILQSFNWKMEVGTLKNSCL